MTFQPTSLDDDVWLETVPRARWFDWLLGVALVVVVFAILVCLAVPA